MKLHLTGILFALVIATAPIHNTAGQVSTNDATHNEGRAEADAISQALRAPDNLATKVLVLDCPIAFPFPDSVLPIGSQVTSFNASWGSNDAFFVALARVPCATDRTQAHILVRIYPTKGVPFICSSDFTVIQGGVQYRVALYQSTASSGGFCGDLFVPTTFFVAQYLDGLYDRTKPLTLIHKGIYETSSADLPAYVIPASATAVEYYWAARDHYFISADPAEIALLDAAPPGGWVRTGESIGVYAQPTGSATSPVCRFYIPVAYGDSHYFSASPSECLAVRTKFPMFTYEAPNVFYVSLPDQVRGFCPAGHVPVYRLWNNRADTNHRYTTSKTIRDQMLAKGYITEGYGENFVSMCVPPT